MHNEQREQFEEWLRTVCFQQPTPEAYDLAWQAWKAAQQSVQRTPEQLDRLHENLDEIIEVGAGGE